MRSFSPHVLSPKAILVASLLSALPLAGAGASPGPSDDVVPPTLHGPRLAAVLGQAQGIGDGIADARRAGRLGAGEARQLEMRAEGAAAMARRVAAEHHGRLPEARYRQILKRLDRIDNRLMVDDGETYANI